MAFNSGVYTCLVVLTADETDLFYCIVQNFGGGKFSQILMKSNELEVYRYGNFGFYHYRLYVCQNLPLPITDPILILHMSSNYSLYLACIKLNGLATYYHVAKLPQHFYTLKLVNYGNIYNCYSNLKLI